MQEATITIDVRNMPHVADRPKKVSEALEQIEPGQYAEIVADDERMLELAPKIVEQIGNARFVKSWRGEDGFYRTLIEKK
ncbi:MAG: sulfurtransferase TusA family protein [Chloroflexota bacterium]